MNKKSKQVINVIGDETPQTFIILQPMTSRSRGETVMPGTIVTRDGFLAGNSDDDIVLYLSMGAIRAVKDGEVKNG